LTNLLEGARKNLFQLRNQFLRALLPCWRKDELFSTSSRAPCG